MLIPSIICLEYGLKLDVHGHVQTVSIVAYTCSSTCTCGTKYCKSITLFFLQNIAYILRNG